MDGAPNTLMIPSKLKSFAMLALMRLWFPLSIVAVMLSLPIVPTERANSPGPKTSFSNGNANNVVLVVLNLFILRIITSSPPLRILSFMSSLEIDRAYRLNPCRESL